MSAFNINIEEKTLQNENFREVLFTSQHNQLVVMSLLPGEEIGTEVHEIVDQFIRIEKGTATALVDGVEFQLSDGSALVIPAGSKHNVINSSPNEKVKLYTIYSPAHHKDKTIHATKAAAEADSSDHI